MTSMQVPAPHFRHRVNQSTPLPVKTTRIEWIDIAKGVGIALVSFGHLRNGDGQSVWLPALDGLISAIYLFHMPLFYLLGGLTFSMRGGFKSFIIRKVKTLLVPYYVFSLYFLAKPFAILLIPSLRTTFQTNHNYGIVHQFYDVLVAGNGLWFLMAFFIGEVIMYGLIMLAGKSRFALTTFGMLLVVGSFCQSTYLPDFRLPFQLLTGIKVAGFMCLGYVLRNFFKRITQKQALMICLFSTFGFTVVAVLVIENNISNLIGCVLVLLAAFLGIAVIVFLCIAISSNKLFASIGRNSLVYYSLNALTLNIIKMGIFRVLHIDVTTWSFILQLGMGIVLTIVALVFLYFENIFIRCHMSWAIGK